MKLSYLTLFAFCLFTLTGNTQEFYKSYDWNETPNFNSKDYADEDLVAAKEKVTTEFYFTEDSQFVEFYLEHKAYYLNSDQAIEDFNKVYLPYDSDSELKINKALPPY